MNCKNCGHTINGNFCSECGQHSKVGRITLSSFLNEVSESIFQIDKGFFFTIYELFVRSGNSLNEFLNGKRKNHFKPIAFVLILSTFYFLITQITDQNTWIDDLLTGWTNGATGETDNSQVPSILNWFSKNYAYSTLILLPVFSLASYLSFLKFDKNYLEHIVINSYITGQQAIFYSFFAFIGNYIESDFVEIFSLLIAVFYAFLVFWQIFSNGKQIKIIYRSILTYVLYWIFSFALLIAIMGIQTMLN